MNRTALAALAGAVLLSGCKSPYINATVTNNTGAPISLVEVDYPSASFGRETLAPGAVYPYRFKIIGSGPTKVSWTDAHHKDHTVPGPDLHEGQHGSLAILLDATTAHWTAHLTP